MLEADFPTATTEEEHMFQLNYLSRYITQDTQAAYSGLEPQTAIVRAGSGISRSINPDRPTSILRSFSRKGYAIVWPKKHVLAMQQSRAREIRENTRHTAARSISTTYEKSSI